MTRGTTLRLYNTLTRTKDTFEPIDAADVRMYVCGPTVYDYAHIGNARPVIVFDVLFRLLRHLYGADHVRYVRNITDVDDKINDRAARDFPDLPLNDAIRRVTESTAAQFHADVKALGCLPPTVEPRATEHIAKMREMIELLKERGFAYEAEGHVLFSPAAMNAANGALPRYGALANRSLDEMIAGARVDVAPYKKDATDFVLWKPSKEGEPGWPSPCGIAGLGRPGWHIECSAMSWAHFGEVFDIHGGGIDLVFPHHENELAQSTCAFGQGVMANVWMHNGFLQVEGQKMSKSLGNFVTIRELLTGWKGRAFSGSALRLSMLQSHYRQPIDWTQDRLQSAQAEIENWAVEIAGYQKSGWPSVSVQEAVEPLVYALSDDLNTPAALARMRSDFADAGTLRALRVRKLALQLEWLGILDERQANIYGSSLGGWNLQALDLAKNKDLIDTAQVAMCNQDEVLFKLVQEGLQERGIEAAARDGKFLTLSKAEEGDDRVASLITARLEARRSKNFAESDRIRDELAAMGILLKDAKDPVTGEPVTTWDVKR